MQASGYASCSGCDRRWSGLKEAHCSSCHRHFISVTPFDLHRTASGVCKDPASVKRKDGKPAMAVSQRATGEVWGVNYEGKANPWVDHEEAA